MERIATPRQKKKMAWWFIQLKKKLLNIKGKEENKAAKKP